VSDLRQEVEDYVPRTEDN